MVRAKSDKLTPMEQQYAVAKAKFPDAILLMRVGDFFEIFGDDALTASRSLGITLTSRDKNNPEAKPMCGVPHHAADAYVARLLADGYRVAMCDQIEDPKEAKGIVQRAITRVYTPGVVLEEDALANTDRRLLGACVSRAGQFGSVWIDFSTGECGMFLASSREEALRWLARSDIFEWATSGETLPMLSERFGQNKVVDATAWQLDENKLDELFPFAARPHLHPLLEHQAVRSALLLAGGYIEHIQLGRLPGLRLPHKDPSFALDPDTVRNLEIFVAGLDSRRKGSLFHAIDKTVSPAGRRQLAECLRRPLHDIDAIVQRQEQIIWLAENTEQRQQLHEHIAHSADCQRIAVKARQQGRVNARDLAGLRDTLASWPAIVQTLSDCQALASLSASIPDPGASCSLLKKALEPEPALLPGKGRVISEGWDEELDRHRALQHNSRTILDQYEQQQRQESGLSGVRIKYSRVFGYFLEIPRTMADQAPSTWTRRQTLSNVERYVTADLEVLSRDLLAAQDLALAREQQLFAELIDHVAKDAQNIIALGEFLAWLDAMLSLATLILYDGWHMPLLHKNDNADVITDGSHPALRKALGDGFVPNSTIFGSENRFHLLTGPNMGGKSTYLKQVGQIYLLAQIGAPVPASRAEISPVDQIFTRVGAGDDIAAGESTFMVEMRQCAHILAAATRRSLILLDEVGRGTSTFDGLSIAWALVHYLQQQIQSRGLFATHYHELAELAQELPDVAVYRMQVSEWEGNVVFMHRVEVGPSSHSYGIHVASLAGLPEDLVQQAKSKLTELEGWNPAPALEEVPPIPLAGEPPTTLKPDETLPAQLTLFPDINSQFLRELAAEDPLNLTPIEALTRLQHYTQAAGKLLRGKKA